uniref:Uncharacterized protein n=1 Tax=Hyaloperonospora arabidopsidis (strain Emoy2) TaxID=559515 RepID=M4BGK0_HYAAE
MAFVRVIILALPWRLQILRRHDGLPEQMQIGDRHFRKLLLTIVEVSRCLQDPSMKCLTIVTKQRVIKCQDMSAPPALRYTIGLVANRRVWQGLWHVARSTTSALCLLDKSRK